MSKSNLFTLVNNFNKLLEKQEKNKLRIIQNNAVYNNKSLFLNSIIEDKYFKHSPYRNIILNYIMKSERYLKGGSFLLLKLMILKIKKLPVNKKIIKKNLENLEKVITQESSSDQYSNFIKQILQFSGSDSSILCKKTKNNIIEVSKNTNPEIFVNISEDFRSLYFKNQNSSTKNFLTICMDAYLERESEISTIISKAIENKQHILVFARGYSENFKRNIKNIILQSKTYIYLYEVKFDNNDPFLLKDIAGILDMSIYSLESGDNVTKDLLQKTKDNYLKVFPNKIKILNPNLKIQEEINKQLKNCTDAILKEYLLKRKKRLTSNTTEVLIPDSNIKLFEEIKNIIHMYNNLAISGFIEFEGQVYTKNIFNFIDNLAERLINTISNISVVVKIKED